MSEMLASRKDEILINAAEQYYAERYPEDGTPLVTKVMLVAEVMAADSQDEADTFVMVSATGDTSVWDAMGFSTYALEVQRQMLESR